MSDDELREFAVRVIDWNNASINHISVTDGSAMMRLAEGVIQQADRIERLKATIRVITGGHAGINDGAGRTDG